MIMLGVLMSFDVLKYQGKWMEMSYLLLYFCKHRVVISDGIASIQIAACVVDPFDYTLIVTIHHDLLLALEYYSVQSQIVTEEIDDGSYTIHFCQTGVCFIVLSWNIPLTAP